MEFLVILQELLCVLFYGFSMVKIRIRSSKKTSTRTLQEKVQKFFNTNFIQFLFILVGIYLFLFVLNLSFTILKAVTIFLILYSVSNNIGNLFPIMNN